MSCPDCDEPLVFAFWDTAGVGAWKQGDGFNTTPDTAHYICFPCGKAWKQGDGFNTTPDTAHYICFPCAKAWKQRLDGPLTQDIVGDLAFFSCREQDCGAAMSVTKESSTPTEIELTCQNGHRFRIVPGPDDGLMLDVMSGGS